MEDWFDDAGLKYYVCAYNLSITYLDNLSYSSVSCNSLARNSVHTASGLTSGCSIESGGVRTHQ